MTFGKRVLTCRQTKYSTNWECWETFLENCKTLVTNLCAITTAIKRESSTKSASAITYYYIVLAADYYPPAESQTPCLVEMSLTVIWTVINFCTTKKYRYKKYKILRKCCPGPPLWLMKLKTWQPVLFRFSLEKPIKNVWKCWLLLTFSLSCLYEPSLLSSIRY